MQNNIRDSEIISSFISEIKNRFDAGQLLARHPPPPPRGTKRSKELNMVDIRNMKSHVSFHLCDQIILHCNKDILEAKLNRFLLKSNVNLFHLSKVLYSVQKSLNFSTIDVR